MSELPETHGKHRETEEPAHSHHSSHDNRQEHNNLYGNYGVDYGERARRILESSNRDSSAFDPKGHSHHAAHGRGHNTLEIDDCGIGGLQRRRHSMFVDTTNVRHGSTPVDHINQMHLDDIVLAYKKKHPHHRTINTNPANDSNDFNVTDKYIQKISEDRNKFASHHEQTHMDEGIHFQHVDKHRSIGSHSISQMTRPCEIHRRGSGSHGSDQHHGEHGKRMGIGGHVAFMNSELADIGTRPIPLSPASDEDHHVSMSRSNAYKNELSSPELERLRAHRDRENKTKEFERHAIAQVITEACRKRHENQNEGCGYQHTHRRHSGQTTRADYAGRPIEGERRHTLSSTTLKEMRHRYGKNKSRIETLRGDDVNEMHGIPLAHGLRHQADIASDLEYGNTHGDILHVPDDSGRRHSLDHVFKPCTF